MPEFCYINLGEDINSVALSLVKQDTWLIFPTERSCKEALTAFQQNWQPLNTVFLSMDEFKRRVVFSEHVRLQDEKRLLCLYQSMTQDDRAAFHIEKYPDIIDWGQHFFSFFEELSEEIIDAENLHQRMKALDFSYQDWQLENYTRMLSIRSQYQQFITDKGYTDAIFDNTTANIHLPTAVKRFVLVNQYYYTKLEKAVIKKIEEKGGKAIVIFQGSPQWLNETALSTNELDIDEAFPDKILPFKLHAYQSLDLWQMALTFLQNHSNTASTEDCRHFIVDSTFLKQPYHKVFNPNLFKYSEPLPMHQTKVFHFIQTMTKGLESIVTDNGKTFVKLDWLLQAIGMDGFVGYFRPKWETLQKDKFTEFVCFFAEKDVLYLDLKLDILAVDWRKTLDKDCCDLLKEIMALLNKLSGVDCLQKLVDIIDDKDGIIVKKLLTEAEIKSSNLLQSFYEGLANFASIDELKLVDDWHKLFPKAELSSGIFDLYLTFFKPKTYRFNTKDAAHPATDITTLMDTRNLTADKVTFMNLVEGILPGSRESVWLFNESQKKAIGLKNWDDIRRWERYYFYRFIASAKEVELYTVFNQEQDIEPSSFMYELLLLAENRSISRQECFLETEISPLTLFHNWLQKDDNSSLAAMVSRSETKEKTFFDMPCDLNADFGINPEIKLSWTACEHFLKNPFIYYLQDLKRLRERIYRREETLDAKMLGTMVHKYMAVLCQRLADQHIGLLSMRWDWITRDFLKANLDSTFIDKALLYQLPKNYNREFLQQLMSPLLIDFAYWFFHTGLGDNEELKDKFINIIPEQEQLQKSEDKYQMLIPPEANPHQIKVSIKGKADLRLETDKNRFIIDFKTGEGELLQLMFYKWTYYLLDNPSMQDRVRAAFCLIKEKSMDWLEERRKSQPEILIEKITESLDKLVTEGFVSTNDLLFGDAIPDIIRRDLKGFLSTDEDSYESAD